MFNFGTVWANFFWLAAIPVILCFHLASKAFEVSFGKFSKFLDTLERYKIGTILASTFLILISIFAVTESVSIDYVELDSDLWSFVNTGINLNLIAAITKFGADVWVWFVLFVLAFLASVFFAVFCIKQNKTSLLISLPALGAVWSALLCNESAKNSFVHSISQQSSWLEIRSTNSMLPTILTIAFLMALATLAYFVTNKATQGKHKALD